jgi:hypothetical protein
MGLGMRMASLLPHFAIWAVLAMDLHYGSTLIYIEDTNVRQWKSAGRRGELTEGPRSRFAKWWFEAGGTKQRAPSQQRVP